MIHSARQALQKYESKHGKDVELRRAYNRLVLKGGACEKKSTKKYMMRNSPAYPASDCCNKLKKGNDGKYYRSVPTGRGCRWIKVQKKAHARKRSASTKVNPRKEEENWPGNPNRSGRAAPKFVELFFDSRIRLRDAVPEKYFLTIKELVSNRSIMALQAPSYNRIIKLVPSDIRYAFDADVDTHVYIGDSTVPWLRYDRPLKNFLRQQLKACDPKNPTPEGCAGRFAKLSDGNIYYSERDYSDQTCRWIKPYDYMRYLFGYKILKSPDKQSFIEVSFEYVRDNGKPWPKNWLANLPKSWVFTGFKEARKTRSNIIWHKASFNGKLYDLPKAEERIFTAFEKERKSGRVARVTIRVKY